MANELGCRTLDTSQKLIIEWPMVASLSLRLFGPMGAAVHGEPLPRMRSRKAKWLLAILTLRNGEPVGRDWLAGMLWPDADREVGLANLRPLISELRKALGEAGGRLQAADRGTILFDVRDAEIDVLEFDRATRVGDDRTTVALYRGPLLEDCSEHWATQERELREIACLSALERLSQTSDASKEAIQWAQRAVAIAPWRDAPRRGLMKLLAEAGEVNAALQVYREFAQLLRSEMGAAPDAVTTELFVQLRWQLNPPRPKPEAATSTAKVSGSLPHPLTALIGREDEQAEIREQIRRSRLVTLVGPGGIGKTRLAREVAHASLGDFPDGVWLIPLEAVLEGHGVKGQIARALDIRESGGSIERLLTERLAGRRLLLLLDNCEHLLESIAMICRSLLESGENLHILATSREALGLVGEKAWNVPALSFPTAEQTPQHVATKVRVAMAYESVQLFAERASAAMDRFTITPDNVDAVIEICARLQGVPLAIELAAARVRSLPIEVLADRLRGHHLALLEGSGYGRNPRQQTLRATLDWSHTLLSATDRTLFRRLSIFSGGWTLEAAEAVGSGGIIGPASVVASLGHLIDKSLVSFDQTSGGGRYGMLETVRQYAREQLEASGEADSVARKHREWFLAFSRRAAEELLLRDQALWQRRLTEETGNIRVILEYGAIEPIFGLEICNALHRYWIRLGRNEEGSLAFTQALSRSAHLEPSEARAMALCNSAALAIRRNNFALAEEHLNEIRSLPMSIVGLRLSARSRSVFGTLSLFLGRNEAAKAAYQEALRIAEEIEDNRIAASSAGNLGVIYGVMGDYRKAVEACEHALRIHESRSDGYSRAFVLNTLGNALRGLGDFQRSRATLEQALETFRVYGDDRETAGCLEHLGQLEFDAGRYATALDHHQESLRICQAVGDQLRQANALRGLGYVHLAKGEATAALDFMEESHMILTKEGHRPGLARTECARAAVLWAIGRGQSAQEAATRSLRLQLELGDQSGFRMSLWTLAGVAFDEGHIERAVTIWAFVERSCESVGAVLPVFFQPRLEAYLSRAKRALGVESFERLWIEGRAFSLENAVSRTTSTEFSPKG